MALIPDAALPEGRRIYAVGDVHGCADALMSLLDSIDQDRRTHPGAAGTVVFLGDYIDRGPDSARVLDVVSARIRSEGAVALAGNHEALMEDFLRNPEGSGHSLWTVNGGDATLASFGLAPEDPFAITTAADRRHLRDRLRETLDTRLPGFLEGLEITYRSGDYLFVHAGLRPGREIADQTVDDMLWIREPFLSSPEDFGAVVVHGHTPTRVVEVRPNRINLDTGCVYGGRLSCLVLENDDRWLLHPSGRVPLGLPR